MSRLILVALISCVALLPALPPEHAHYDEQHHVRVVHRHFESHRQPGNVVGHSSDKGHIVWLSAEERDVDWLSGAINPQLTRQTGLPEAGFVCFGDVAPFRRTALSAEAAPPPHGPPRSTLL